MIAIINYNAGNTRSVQNAVEKAGFKCIVTDNKEELMRADKVILPGVGEASTAMAYLREKGLDQLIISLRQPVLGICLGLQLMCKSSEENHVDCLGIFDVLVKRFPPTDLVPHMGWNNLQQIKGKLFDGITVTDNAYFVHSYYAELGTHSVASCGYILPFSAAMQKDNFYATQFHPEKSGEAGEAILKNFLSI